MEDFRKDEIFYEEDWKHFDEPVLAQKYEHDSGDTQQTEKSETPKKAEKQKRNFPALITIQLVLSLLIAFLVFMLKAMNSDTYKQLCEYYDELMQETLFSSSVFEDIDLSQYFEATADEVLSTNDEV